MARSNQEAFRRSNRSRWKFPASEPGKYARSHRIHRRRRPGRFQVENHYRRPVGTQQAAGPVDASAAPLKLEPAAQLPAVTRATGLKLGDLDQDGDLDLFVTGHHGNQAWFNDGQGRFQAREQRLGDGQCEAVELVDLDADHDLDAVLVAGAWVGSRPRFVWLNDGNGRFQKGPALTTGFTQSLASGDLDGDGDHDVVFGNVSASANNRSPPAEVWFNQSNQSTIP